MDHNKTSFQELLALFPDVESPVTCNDIYNRIFPIRDLICDALGPDVVWSAVFDVQKADRFGPLKLFESDKDLRERLADLALSLFLSVEAYQAPSEILKDCTPEIKSHIVPAVNLFYRWFLKKALLQTKGILNRGNLALTWTYLFAEFRKDLEHYNKDRWTQSLQEPFFAE